MLRGFTCKIVEAVHFIIHWNLHDIFIQFYPFIIATCVIGDKYYFHKQCRNRSALMMISVAELGKGGGLLEKPTIEKTTPGRESEFDVRYKTLLL